MRRLLLAAALGFLPLAAGAQSLPFPISQGTVWTPAMWTTAWTSKADTASLPTSGNFNAAFPTSGTPIGAQNSGVMVPLNTDAAGNLLVNIAAGSAAGGTSSNFLAAYPSVGTAMGAKFGPNMVNLTADALGNLLVSQQNPIPAGTNLIGTVVATGGTNLNTSTLAVETGGNLSTLASSVLSQTTATSGAVGNMVMGAVTASAPTYTTAQLNPISLDTAGNLRINCTTGCSSSGGSSLADEATFTQGTTSFTAIGGTYNTSITNLTAGQAGVAQLTLDRMLYVNVGKIGGTAVNNGGVNGAQGVGGPTASGSAVAANPLTVGARAENAEPTAVANGQVVNLASDLVGKLIVMPYSNKENFLVGTTTAITTATNTQVIAAQGSGVKIYMTEFSCSNTGATTSSIDFTSATGGTEMWNTIVPAGGGTNMQLPVPVPTAANAALFVTTGSASTSIKCTVGAYKGT